MRKGEGTNGKIDRNIKSDADRLLWYFPFVPRFPFPRPRSRHSYSVTSLLFFVMNCHQFDNFKRAHAIGRLDSHLISLFFI